MAGENEYFVLTGKGPRDKKQIEDKYVSERRKRSEKERQSEKSIDKRNEKRSQKASDKEKTKDAKRGEKDPHRHDKARRRTHHKAKKSDTDVREIRRPGVLNRLSEIGRGSRSSKKESKRVDEVENSAESHKESSSMVALSEERHTSDAELESSEDITMSGVSSQPSSQDAEMSRNTSSEEASSDEATSTDESSNSESTSQSSSEDESSRRALPVIESENESDEQMSERKSSSHVVEATIYQDNPKRSGEKSGLGKATRGTRSGERTSTRNVQCAPEAAPLTPPLRRRTKAHPPICPRCAIAHCLDAATRTCDNRATQKAVVYIVHCLVLLVLGSFGVR